MQNVSEATLYWYRASYKTWIKYSAGDPKTWVMGMRAAGISPRSVNTHICALNAYWRWAGEPIKLAYLKEEQKILATLNEAHVKALLAYKPKGTNETRAHMAALTILDTGIRASELFGIMPDAIDWDNLILKVLGKGNKHRLVLVLPGAAQAAVPVRKPKRPALRLRHVQGNEAHHPKLGARHLEARRERRDLRRPLLGAYAATHVCGCVPSSWQRLFLSRILGHTSVKTTEI